MTKIVENDTSYTNTRDIINQCTSYYKNLLSEEEVDSSLMNMFLSRLPKVDDECASLCDGLITVDECLEALRTMAPARSPGLDGLPAEFYLKVWPIIGPTYTKYINYCYESGSLCNSQKLAVITLLCENTKEPQFLKNWRPISLLNVDFKIISKVLTARLKVVLPSIISETQTCAIPGRSILNNAHFIRNLFDYSDQKNYGCGIISLDQMKAFDRISHIFLFNCLKVYGFHDSFIKWIRLLYTDIKSSCLVNGFISESFPVTRSVRQGCSLSPLLYVLCIEALAVSVKLDPHISGVKLPGQQQDQRIIQYADDTTVLVSNVQSVKKVVLLSELFGLASGSKININKTCGIWLGSLRGSGNVCNINFCQNSIKILGIHFSSCNKLVKELNWKPIINGVTKSLNNLKDRHLSYRGKVKAISSIALSKLWYVGTNVPISPNVLFVVNSLIFNFFWNDSTERIKRNVLYLPKAMGGLDLPCVSLKLLALHQTYMSLCN